MKKPEPGVRKDKTRGTWLYALDVPGLDGKRRQELRRGFATMDDANTAIRTRRAELNAGLIPIPADESVAAFKESWIGALPAEGIEPATIKHYSESVARLLPTIGGIKLQQLTGHDLDRAYDGLRNLGRSARTVRGSHVAVKKMLNEAIRLKKVACNVADDARPPKAKAARAKKFDTWTRSELETFL